jgi:hypothetical protein
MVQTSIAHRVSALLMLIVTSLIAQESSDYKPHPQDGLPQIIQASDFATIKFIESIYTSISRLGVRTDYYVGGVDCVVEGQSVKFRSQHDSTMYATLRMSGRKPVLLDSARFNDSNVSTLCYTLLKIFTDLSRDSLCEGIRVANLPNRSYKKRIIIEFKFRSRIISLESDSEGHRKSNRSYSLDFTAERNSFFWNHDE